MRKFAVISPRLQAVTEIVLDEYVQCILTISCVDLQSAYNFTHELMQAEIRGIALSRIGLPKDSLSDQFRTPTRLRSGKT
jgi:hypothetical protein